MTQTQLTLYIIKLVLGGLATFFAILVWGKTRDAAWMSLVAGIVLEYCGTVYNMFLDFGVVFTSDLKIADIARDGQIVQLARDEAQKIIDADPTCEKPEYAMLWQHLDALKKSNINWGAIS